MKKIKCDFCGKDISLKQGELFVLEVQKITNDLSRYPDSYDSDFLYMKDLCKKCLRRIEFLIGLKKIKPKKLKQNKKKK